MLPKFVIGMANNEDSNQAAPSGSMLFAKTVCQDLSTLFAKTCLRCLPRPVYTVCQDLSTLFAKTCLFKNLGSLRYFTVKIFFRVSEIFFSSFNTGMTMLHFTVFSWSTGIPTSLSKTSISSTVSYKSNLCLELWNIMQLLYMDCQNVFSVICALINKCHVAIAIIMFLALSYIRFICLKKKTKQKN